MAVNKKGRKTRGNKTHDQRGWCSIFDELSCHEGITQKHPEKRRDSTCMNGCKNDEGCGSLLEKGTCSDELKGEGEKVDDKKGTKFDTACSCVGHLEQRQVGGQDSPTAAFR